MTKPELKIVAINRELYERLYSALQNPKKVKGVSQALLEKIINSSEELKMARKEEVITNGALAWSYSRTDAATMGPLALVYGYKVLTEQFPEMPDADIPNKFKGKKVAFFAFIEQLEPKNRLLTLYLLDKAGPK